MTKAARSYVGTRNCATCGAQFQARRDNSSGKYCSVKCSNAGRSMPLTADPALVAKLYLEGLGTVEIAKRFGTTWKHVSRALKARGLNIKPGRRDKGTGKSRIYRTLAQTKIGRPIARGEVVHHLDGNRCNNLTENLVVVSRKRHGELHAQLEKISLHLFARSLLRYDPEKGYVPNAKLLSILDQ